MDVWMSCLPSRGNKQQAFWSESLKRFSLRVIRSEFQVWKKRPHKYPAPSHSPSHYVMWLMVSRAALLVYSTAELIRRFMADLQPDRQTTKMIAVLSLLPTRGLVKRGINTKHMLERTHKWLVCPKWTCAFVCTCVKMWSRRSHATCVDLRNHRTGNSRYLS